MRTKLFLFIVSYILCTSNSAQLTLQQLQVLYDSAFTCNNIQLIPIQFKPKLSTVLLPNNILSLTEAIQQNKVVVNEFYYLQEANVQILSIKNKSNQFIWIEPGTILKGGKQDRMVVSSKLIEPKAALDFIDVFCIEKKRWDKREKKFIAAGFVDRYLMQYIDSVHAQKAIWNAIEQRLLLPDSIALTRAYLQTAIATKNDTACLQACTRFLQSNNNFSGFIAITDTTIIGAEVFSNNYLLHQYANSIIKGYITAANYTATAPSIQPKQIHYFVQQWLATEETQKQFLKKHGKAYYYNNKPFHIIAFTFK